MNEPASPSKDLATPPVPAARTSSGFVAAFLASALGTGLSRVFGAARDIAVASYLGAGVSSDAFWIAFTIPNTFRRFVADEGLTGALVPAVAKAEQDEGTPRAKQVANTLFTALLLANLVICGLGMWQAEWVVLLFAADWYDEPEKLALAASLARWLFPFVAFVSLVSFAEGLLNHRHHFFVPKFAPALVSAGMVAALVLLTGSWEPVWALVAGTLVGGAVHLAVCIPPLLSRWGRPRLSLAFGDPRVRSVLRELSKVVAIGLFAQVNLLVIRNLAVTQADGAVTWYWNANRLVDLAQGIIAVAVGSALLPAISRSVAAEEWDRFRRELNGGLRLAAFVLLPTALCTATFATPLAALMFRHGQYTWEDVQWTGLTLALLTPFMLAVAGIQIVKKAYFAIDDRNTLLGVGAVGVLLTAALGVPLVRELSVAGLGLALSLSTLLQLVLYLVLLRRRLGTRLGLGELISPLGRMILAALPPAAILYGAGLAGRWPDGPSWGNLGVTLAGGLLAVGAYLALAWMLRIEELQDLQRRLRLRLSRRSS